MRVGLKGGVVGGGVAFLGWVGGGGGRGGGVWRKLLLMEHLTRTDRSNVRLELMRVRAALVTTMRFGMRTSFPRTMRLILKSVDLTMTNMVAMAVLITPLRRCIHGRDEVPYTFMALQNSRPNQPSWALSQY